MFPFDLIHIVIVLAVAGLILWAITQFPLDATIAKLIRVVVVVFVCIWLLLGLGNMMSSTGGFGTRHSFMNSTHHKSMLA